MQTKTAIQEEGAHSKPKVTYRISARKQAEEALCEAHDQLAEKVIARTVERAWVN